jgi:quercetin dioxygenase-like cupin family protein
MLRLCAVFLIAFTSTALAQTRTELKRSDLTGTNMEVIVMAVEFQPGETIARHTHHGEEAVYVLQGATLAGADGKEIQFPTGASIVNQRDVPHGGFKIVGDKSLKMLNVFVVDKGKPLTEPAQ